MTTSFVRLVRNQSSRAGIRPQIMVLHTTEGHNRQGTSDLEGLASYFDNPHAQASSHFGVDAEGNSCRMVPDENKSWTQSNYNSVSLSIEQVGFAATSRREWFQTYRHGLYRTASILADWHLKWDIPLKHSTSRGVCQHKNLGILGGGHHDCGDGYPERYVILLARLIVLRKTGRNKSLKARRLKARLWAAQRRYGIKHPTTTS